MTASLQSVPAHAARYLIDHGWTQGEDVDADTGAVCLTGAIRRCSPVPGDAEVVIAVFTYRDRAEDWNDDEDRTADEVVGYLAAATITDDDLEVVFGPQWPQIIAAARTLATLTNAQRAEVAHARRAVPVALAGNSSYGTYGAFSSALTSTREAAGHVDLGAAVQAAQDTAIRASAADPGCVDTVAAAALGAVRALAVRHLIGRFTFTQAHYDLLTYPWRTAIGSLHPDDGPLLVA